MGGRGILPRVIGAVRACGAGDDDRGADAGLPAQARRSLEVVAEARPDVFNHNLETAPRLYPTIRPGARYYQSAAICWTG